MSFVDHRVGLAAGRVRLLLARALVVLGGAFAVTAVGWLLCAGSASADTLPPVPVIPSVVSAIAPQLSTPDIKPPALRAAPALPLDGVTKQVHVAVSGVGDKVDKVHKVAPAVTPVTDPVLHQDRPVAPAKRVVVPTQHHVSTPAATVEAAPATPVTLVPDVLVQHRHVIVTPMQAQRPVPLAPPGAGHHTPLLPPLQPAGSSDSSAHGAGSVAGGAGGAHLPFTHVLGGGLNLAGAPSTSRIAVAPGQQPGTSPD